MLVPLTGISIVSAKRQNLIILKPNCTVHLTLARACHLGFDSIRRRLAVSKVSCSIFLNIACLLLCVATIYLYLVASLWSCIEPLGVHRITWSAGDEQSASSFGVYNETTLTAALEVVRVASSVDAASASRGSPQVPAVIRSGSVHYGSGVSCVVGGSGGCFDAPDDSSLVYGGTRPLKSSFYRRCSRANSGSGSGLVRNASFVSHSRSRSRSSNLDSDPEVLTVLGGGGGSAPVPFSSFLPYGHASGPNVGGGGGGGGGYAASSAGSHRSSGASVQLCRCGSGGPLLPSASNSPPTLSPLPPQPQPPPPLPNSLPPSTAYSRLVQSLPSTPNAARRPVSPMRPSFCHQLPALDASLPSQSSGSRPMSGLPFTKHQHLTHTQTAPLPPPSQASTQHVPLFGSVSRPECAAGAPLIPNDSPASFRSENRRGAATTTTATATTSCNESASSSGRPAQKGLRALQQWTRSQRQRNNVCNHMQSGGPMHQTSHTYSSSVQPLMKLSTLIIVLLAFLIIGFIVLSPLFHYLM